MVCGASFGGAGWRWCAEADPRTGDATLGDERERQVVGDYELLDALGQGGVGVVYRGRDLDSDAEVAIKLLATGSRSTPRQRERFQREIAAQMRDDPGIVRVLEQGVSALGPWYAMELVQGPALSAVLQSAGRLPTAEAVRVTLAVGETLVRMHRQGLCHRDVKPSNVLMTPQGEPKLGDFGLVLRSDHDTRLTATHQAVGTPRYMAPEQLAAAVEDWTRVDQYALGVMLYELLGGGLERSGGAERTLPDLPTADRDLMWILERCTAFDPASRYPAMRDLCDDLRRWQDGTAVRNRPNALAGRAERWMRANPATVAAVVGVAVLSSMGVAAWTQARISQARTDQAAQAQWSALQERLEPLAWSDATPEFDAFVLSPQAQGSDVLTRAWLWRSARPDALPADAMDAAGRAAFARDPDVPDVRGLTRMAELAHAQARWTAVAGIDAMAPDAVTDWQRAHVALAYADFDRAEALLDAPGLFQLFKGGAPLDQRPPAAHGVVAQLDDALTAPTWTGERIDLPPGCALRPAHLIQCHDGRAWWAASGALDPIPRPDSATFAAEINGRRFVSTNDQVSVLLELGDAGWSPAHGPTTDLHSYGTGLAAVDLDHDGQDELLLELNQPNGYGVWAYRVPADGPIEPVGLARIGDVTPAAVARTARGDQVVLATTRSIPSAQLFGTQDPYGGPARLLSVTLTPQGELDLQVLQVLPEVPHIHDTLTAIDLDGDGLDEVVLTIDTPTGRAAMVLQGTPSGFGAPVVVPHVWLAGGLAPGPDGQARAIGATTSREPGTPPTWWVLGDPGRPIEPTPLPDPGALPRPEMLERLGLLEESARAWLALAGAAEGQHPGAHAEAARLWALAGHPKLAADAAEAAGDRARAAEYALADDDWQRAADLDPLWSSLAEPGFELDLTRPLPPWIQAPLAPAVRHDMASARLQLELVRGAEEVLRIPVRTTGAPIGVHLDLEIERMDWSSGVRVGLYAPDGSPGPFSTPVFHLGAFGSGGQLSRGLKSPCPGAGWPVDTSTDPDTVTLRRISTHCTIQRDGARVSSTLPAARPLPAGTPLVLTIGALPNAEGQNLSAATVVVTALRLHGLEPDPDQPPRPLAPWEQWVNGGPTPRDLAQPHVALHLRLRPERLDALLDELGPDAVHDGFVRAWGQASNLHLDDPVVLAQIARAPGLDTLDDWVAAQFLVRQGRAALRTGDPQTAERLALQAQSRAGTQDWRTTMGAATLLAELALLHGDTARALELATRAAESAPDASLGWHILTHRDRFKALRDEPGWEALKAAAAPAL